MHCLVHGNPKRMHMTYNQIKHLKEYFEYLICGLNMKYTEVAKKLLVSYMCFIMHEEWWDAGISRKEQ